MALGLQIDSLASGLIDANGDPLASGKVYFTEAGASGRMVSAKTVYQDALLTIPHTSPVILNTRGSAIVFTDGACKIWVYDANDSLVYAIDNAYYVRTITAEEANVYNLVAGTYTIDGTTYTDGNYLINSAGGAVNINMPVTASYAGKQFTFIKISSDSNSTTLTANGTEKIDGASTMVFSAVGSIRLLLSNGTTGWQSANTTATSATNATNVTTNIDGHAITDILETNGTTVKNATASSTSTNATNVTTTINGNAISSIFESDGTTAKDATDATNATNVTTNINSHAITDIFESDGTTAKNATTSANATTTANSLIGMVAPFACATAPSGWLACDGTAVSRTTYASLFTVIGTTWGIGDGSTTFNLPDLDGEFIRGASGTRAVGSVEATSNLAHAHTFTGSALGAHNHTFTGTAGSHTHTDSGHSHPVSLYSGGGASDLCIKDWASALTPGYLLGTFPTNSASANISSTSITPVGTNSSNTAGTPAGTIDSVGGTESRPRNIALLYCIKAT